MSRFFKRVTTTFLGLVLAIFMVLNTTPYSLKVEATDLMEGIESNNVEGKTVDEGLLSLHQTFQLRCSKGLLMMRIRWFRLSPSCWHFA